ncbi:MAG TPA: transposase [Gaiellaceae bacterium]|nr:transposase [Gaiellaceae bacterium]
MPRHPRAFRDGIFHVTPHASDLRYLFLNDADREDFLVRLAAVCERFELSLLSYVLMGNHYHVIVRSPDARLSQALQRLHTEYSRHHNRRHWRCSAHLFRAHAKARELESNEDLVGACRYLARNPVEANLVPEPLAWPWGSARAHAGLEQPRVPLAENDLRGAFGGTNWRENYRMQVEGS